MSIPVAKLQLQPIPPSPIILSDELISEVLSLLDVKSLMRMKCVSKSWNSLVSHDPTFIKMHLKKSTRNLQVTLILDNSINNIILTVVSFPLHRLLKNHSMILADDHPCYQLKDKDCCWVIGSCNGLLCLLGVSFTIEYQDYWLHFWNPATRTISEKLGYFRKYSKGLYAHFKFTFGYDNSSGTYKVVALRFIEDQVRVEARVFSLGENVWRDIQSFRMVPLQWYNAPFVMNAAVYLSGTLNWLALPKKFRYDHERWKDITIDQFVIISLDLCTETHRQLPLPQGFDEVPPVEPTVCVLMDCLCFSHDFKRPYFVIWQMTEFGVGESWTQFLKIGYQNLQYDMTILRHYYFPLLPLSVSENADILIWTNDEESQTILYNWRDNRVKKVKITGALHCFSSKDYVESFVSPF